MTEIARFAIAAGAIAAVCAVSPLTETGRPWRDRLGLAAVKTGAAVASLALVGYCGRSIAFQAGELLQFAAGVGMLAALSVFVFLRWRSETEFGRRPLIRLAWIVGAAIVLLVSLSIISHPGDVARGLSHQGDEGGGDEGGGF